MRNKIQHDKNSNYSELVASYGTRSRNLAKSTLEILRPCAMQMDYLFTYLFY